MKLLSTLTILLSTLSACTQAPTYAIGDCFDIFYKHVKFDQIKIVVADESGVVVINSHDTLSAAGKARFNGILRDLLSDKNDISAIKAPCEVK